MEGFWRPTSWTSTFHRQIPSFVPVILRAKIGRVACNGILKVTMFLEEKIPKEANNLAVEWTFPRPSPGNLEPEPPPVLKHLVVRIVTQENMKKCVAIVAVLDSAEVRIELWRSVSHHQRRGPAIKRVLSA